MLRASLWATGLILTALTPCTRAMHAAEPASSRPNILFCLADDQSWPHASVYGDKVIKTPVTDRIAREGVLFSHAYCPSPSCTPSRSGILTGQHIWRLGEGAQLFGTLPSVYPVYTELLEESGYHVGYTLKGWSPGNAQAGGRKRNPAGKNYANFKAFLDKAGKGQPWCFWFGSHDPHRGYKAGSGIASGMNAKEVEVPPVFADTPETRSDICDYYFAIQRFDRDVGDILKLIEDAGQPENTIVVITSDNGMPFPRGKATLYDLGVRMPLVISWKQRIPGGRTVDDFVSLTDLAPTFLEAAGLKPPECMTGKSLLNILCSRKSGFIEPDRDCVFTARERHAWCRVDGRGYPSRMIRTKDFLYIRNYEPDRWPAGMAEMVTNEGPYGDVDKSPTKDGLLKLSEDPKELVALSFGKRPGEELYDCRTDPYQIRNVANDPAYKATREQLSARVTTYLKQTGDPRETSGKVLWDEWPYYGRHDWKVVPEKK